MWKDTELSYLAGIMDGEGFISARERKDEKSLTLQVGIVTTDLPLLEWIQERFGGKVYHRPPNRKHPEWKPKYEWRMSAGITIDTIIPAIRPYLIIKARHADLLMKLRETYGNRNYHYLPQELQEKRLEIVYQIQDMNRGRKQRTGLPTP